MDWIVKNYFLEIYLSSEEKELRAYSKLVIESVSKWHVPVLLGLNKNFKVFEVKVEGKEKDFSEKTGKLVDYFPEDYKIIDIGEELSPGEKIVIELNYGGKRPTVSLPEEKGFFLTPETLWYPVNAKTPLLDYQRPSATAEIHVETIRDYTVFCTGKLLEVKKGNEKKKYSFKLDKVGPLALFASNYSVLKKGTIYYSLFKEHEKLLEDLAEKAKDIIAALEKILGPLPYTPLYIVEGTNFVSHYLVSLDYSVVYKVVEKTLSEVDLQQHLAEQLAKCYWGAYIYVNKLSSGSFWLTESLPRYLSYIVIKERNPKEAEKILKKAKEKYSELKELGREPPVAEATKENSGAYWTPLKEGKGILLHYMLHRILGEDYFNLLRKLLEEYSWKTIKLKDFTKTTLKLYPRLKWFIEDWINSASLPLYKIKVVDLAKAGSSWYVGFKIVNEGLGRAPLKVVVLTEQGGKVERREWIGSKDYRKIVVRLLDKPIQIILDPENIILKHPSSQTSVKV